MKEAETGASADFLRLWKSFDTWHSMRNNILTLVTTISVFVWITIMVAAFSSLSQRVPQGRSVGTFPLVMRQQQASSGNRGRGTVSFERNSPVCR